MSIQSIVEIPPVTPISIELSVINILSILLQTEVQDVRKLKPSHIKKKVLNTSNNWRVQRGIYQGTRWFIE